MSKTLLKHFTFTDTTSHNSPQKTEMYNDCLADLEQELEPILQQAKAEVLTPRKKVIDELLSKAMSTQ